VNLDDAEMRQVLYLAAQERRARLAAGHPPGDWLLRLERRLELEVAVSRSRQDESVNLQLSNHDDEWIGTRTAAACLGWTSRKVQRHAADFDGQLASCGWVFRAKAVLEYAAGLNDDRDTADTA